MGLEEDVALFQRVPLFALLGRQALKILAIGAESKQLPTGAVLFYAGELADGGYLVQDGSLVLESGLLSGDQDTVIGPGEMIGELALLTDMVCPATAMAQEPTVVIRIPRSLFKKVLEGFPEAAVKLRDVMAARLGGLTQELTSVKSKIERGL
jgi:CRP-like cAMP-binding protein